MNQNPRGHGRTQLREPLDLRRQLLSKSALETHVAAAEPALDLCGTGLLLLMGLNIVKRAGTIFEKTLALLQKDQPVPQKACSARADKLSSQVPRARTAATPPDLVRLLYRRHSYPHLKRLLQRCAAAAGAEYLI